MLDFKINICAIFAFIILSSLQYVMAQASSAAIAIHRVNFDAPFKLAREAVTDIEFPFLWDNSLILGDDNVHKMFFTLVPSAETDEDGWLTEQVKFSIEFSSPVANLPEISNYYVKAGADDVTPADDVVSGGDGGWWFNFEPRRMSPDSASGQWSELLSEVNVVDPTGEKYSAVVKWYCHVEDTATTCLKSMIMLQEVGVEGPAEE